MEVFKTKSMSNNRRHVVFRDGEAPVPAYTCTYLPTKVVNAPPAIAGIAEITRRGSQYTNVYITPTDLTVPYILVHSQPGENLFDYVKTFEVDLTPKKSNAQKRREASRWRRSKETGEIVINPREAFKASVRVIPKPGVVKTISTTVYFPRESQCKDDPTANVTGTWYASHNGNTFQSLTHGPKGDPLVGGFPVIATLTGEGGLVSSPLAKSFNQDWADQLCRDLFLAIKTEFTVDKGLTTKVLAEANTRGVDLIANLGEMPETLLAITKLVKGARNLKKEIRTTVKHFDVKGGLRKRLIRDARDKRRKRLTPEHVAASERNSVKVLDAVASLWMGHRYGAQPIGLTIRQIMEEMAANYRHYQTDRGGARRNASYDFKGTNYSFEVIDRVWNKREYLLERHLLQQMFYLDLPSAAWELLPVSFVTDWFLNVGDVINACGYPDVKFKDSSSYSWKGTGSLTLETATAYVEINFDAYVLRPIRLAEHISLQFDYNMGLKRHMDAAALSWFAFKSNGLGGRVI